MSTAQKLSNRNIILKYLFRNSPVARIDIANETNITPATVTATVRDLIKENLVREVGDDPVLSSGRKPILIDFISENILNVGIEFTEKGVQACLCDASGKILFSEYEEFTPDTPKRINEIIIFLAEKLFEKTDISLVKGIGIALPGHINRQGEKLISNRKIWSDFNPVFIQEHFALPVSFENNIRCMALSQYFFKPKNTPDSFSFFHIGLGMFCANMIKGDLFLGNSYISGEIGHTIVSSGGPKCECGKYGCLQTFSSERWLLKYAKLLYQNHASVVLDSLVENEEEIKLEHITTAYSMGDTLIRSYIGNALKYLGNSISNIAILMNPDKIFLHSKMFDNADIKDEIMSLIKDQLLFMDSIYVNNIEICSFDKVDGAVGGAALSLLKNFIEV